MAAINGDTITLQSRSTSPTTGNLGKRKRSYSPDPLTEDDKVESQNGTRLQQSMESMLKLLRAYDPSPSLLRYPLPTISSTEPNAKRVRLARIDQEFETIEHRVLSGSYKFLEEMVIDINRAASAILDSSQALAEQVNGEARSRTGADIKAKEQITMIRDLVTKQLHRSKGVQNGLEEVINVNISNIDDQDRGQVLTLRTQTEKGPKQIYSGLQISRSTDSTNTSTRIFQHIDGKLLPNGFELTDPTLLSAHMKSMHEHENRTFGEVFKPNQKLKALDLPQTPRNSGKPSMLNFQTFDKRIFDSTLPTFKGDYKFSSLPTGQWLQYGDKSGSGIQKRQKDRLPSNNGGDDGNDEIDRLEDAKTKALFQQTYSSFAPIHDNSSAVISDRIRGQIWWRKTGQYRFQTLFSLQYPEDVLTGHSTSNDEFADLVTDFQPEDKGMIDKDDKSNEKRTDALLEEISDLLETLNSYQRMRNLETSKPSNSSSSPSSAEFDTYEILKLQLTILIGTLPPFAMAKLNGDQLEELGISTKLVTTPADYSGTAEVDDFTLEKRKVAQAATATARTTTSSATPARPNSYQTPSAAATVAASYNPRTRSYNTNVPASNTPGQSFQTPRIPVTVPRPNFPQQSYQPNTPYAQHANVQQFQRPIPNGYTNYAKSTSQPTYLQRTTPTAYQQNTTIDRRSGSPQKVMMNGQTTQLPYSSQPQTQFQTRSQGLGSYSPAIQAVQNMTTDQRAMMERLKAQNQIQPGQRQGSGTPHPQTPGASSDSGPGYGRYDGVDEQTSSGLETRQMPLAVGETSR